VAIQKRLGFLITCFAGAISKVLFQARALCWVDVTSIVLLCTLPCSRAGTEHFNADLGDTRV
jgi:hypothetical protein